MSQAKLEQYQRMIAEGRRAEVEQIFNDLYNSKMVRSSKSGDISYESDPIAVREHLEILAKALGYDPIQGMVRIR